MTQNPNWPDNWTAERDRAEGQLREIAKTGGDLRRGDDGFLRIVHPHAPAPTSNDSGTPQRPNVP